MSPLTQSVEEKALWKRSNKLMDVHAFVRLDDMRDPEGTSSHTRHFEARFFVQVILLPEDGKKCSVNEWFVSESPLDGIAEQYLPGPSLVRTDESSWLSSRSHELEMSQRHQEMSAEHIHSLL